MERVAFLVEPDDHRISCMLNPETIVITRSSGIRERESIGGAVSGKNLNDVPLIFTGGGVTYIEMELLFDITIKGSSLITKDVRDYTSNFFEMAENSYDNNGSKRPKIVRMIWGKSWNIPGVITEIAEKLDYFTKGGVPRRSWLKLRLRRVNEEDTISDFIEKIVELLNESLTIADELDATSPYGQSYESEELRAKSITVMLNDRLDAIADKYYNDPSLWRLIASFNGITDIAEDIGSRLIQIPPIDEIMAKVL